MPLSDSPYTNPDQLRSLYVNPLNPLTPLSELITDMTQQQFAALPLSVVSPQPAITSGGGGGGPISGCPAVGQFAAGFIDNRVGAILVEKLRKNVDYLWQPIVGEFRKVIRSVIVPDTHCVRYRTVDGAESIVSITDMVIQSIDDPAGRQILDMMESVSHRGSVSCFGPANYRGVNSAIAWIKYIGQHSIVKISLEGEHGDIYASGTDPEAMTARHNNKPEGGDPLID